MKLLISLLLLATFTLTAAERKRALPVYCPECKETLSLVPLRTVTNATDVVNGDTIIRTTVTCKCPVSGKKFTSGHDIYVGRAPHANEPPLPPGATALFDLTSTNRSVVWVKGKL